MTACNGVHTPENGGIGDTSPKDRCTADAITQMFISSQCLLFHRYGVSTRWGLHSSHLCPVSKTVIPCKIVACHCMERVRDLLESRIYILKLSDIFERLVLMQPRS